MLSDKKNTGSVFVQILGLGTSWLVLLYTVFPILSVKQLPIMTTHMSLELYMNKNRLVFPPTKSMQKGTKAFCLCK